MARRSVFDMKVSAVYPLPVRKAERKGRSKDEADQVISWLTGYNICKSFSRVRKNCHTKSLLYTVAEIVDTVKPERLSCCSDAHPV